LQLQQRRYYFLLEERWFAKQSRAVLEEGETVRCCWLLLLLPVAAGMWLLKGEKRSQKPEQKQPAW
jgi:hypothetical protein